MSKVDMFWCERVENKGKGKFSWYVLCEERVGQMIVFNLDEQIHGNNTERIAKGFTDRLNAAVKLWVKDS